MQLLTPDEVLKLIQEGKQVEVKFGEDYDWEYVLPHKMVIDELIDPEHQFRIAQQLICIDDVEFPKPETEKPKLLSEYYIADLSDDAYYSQAVWHGTEWDLHYLNVGIVHLNKENAIEHAKALIKLNTGDINV